MHNTEKTSPQSSYELLGASFAQYKEEHAIFEDSIQVADLNRKETIAVNLFLKLLEELENDRSK